jgi:hypothetical protein
MKPTMTIDTGVFDADSIVVCFDKRDEISDEQTHFGGYVRIKQFDNDQCFNVVVIDVNGYVLSETTVPYNFISVDEI